MATQADRPARARSSTVASRGLTADEQTSLIAKLIQQLDETTINDENTKLDTILHELQTQITTGLAQQDIFRRCGGFELISSILHALADRARSLSTLHSICLLLVFALNRHDGNRRYFSGRVHGWQELEDCFTTSCYTFIRLSDIDVRVQGLQQICTTLMTIATSAEYEPSPAEVMLQHPEAVAILIRLALQIDEPGDKSSMLPYLQAVQKSVATHAGNQMRLWATGVDSDLFLDALHEHKLDEWTECFSNIFRTISQFGLHSLDDVATLFEQACASETSRRLLLELCKNSKEPAIIHFDLAQHGHCAVELPSLPKNFPPTTGYTLSLWARFDRFDHNHHTTIFGAFDASQSCFVLVYLEKDSHHLILQTSLRSSRPSVRFKSTSFTQGKWYHIALVHRRATQDSKQSPAMLFVDGEFAEQVKCAYPEPPQPDRSAPHRLLPTQVFLGTPRDLTTKPGAAQVNSSWSLASANLFQMPLTDEFIAVQRRLGPRYTGNFQDCLGPFLTYKASAELQRYNDLLHPDKSEPSDINQATEHRSSEVVSESKIYFSFSAKSVRYIDGRKSNNALSRDELDHKAQVRFTQLAQKVTTIALNGAVPSINDAISRSYGTAALTGDPIVNCPSSLDDASWRLAGSVPLLYKLLESASSQEAFLQCVRIFFECVKDNWRISEAIEKSNGYALLALIIRQRLGFESGATTTATSLTQMSQLSFEERQTMPYDLLVVILEAVGWESAAPERSMIVNPMAYRVLLVDFDTWRRCDGRTSDLYYAQFAHFVVRNQHSAFNHKRLNRMRIIKRMIDALKTEDFEATAAGQLVIALHALMENPTSSNAYKDLAMFVAYGFQDDRAITQKPIRHMASIVRMRQHAASWSDKRRSRPGTPSETVARPPLTRQQLALDVLTLLSDTLCGTRSGIPIRRFIKAVPTRWLSHLLAENEPKVIVLVTRIICHALATLSAEFKHPFVDKNGGFQALRVRIKSYWRCSELWVLLFAMLFGQRSIELPPQSSLTVQQLHEAVDTDGDHKVVHPDVLPVLMAMLEASLRHVVRDGSDPFDAQTLTTVIRFLNELFTRSQSFRDFAISSRYAQELIFVLYPVVVGSDRLAADTEMQAEKDSLSFNGEEVVMRPHSNSVGQRPPSVRSLTFDKSARTPSPSKRRVAHAPRRLSSFVLVSASNGTTTLPTTRFNSAISPQAKEPVKLNVGNSLVEALMEILVDLFINQICDKKDFNGVGLFQKVPPGFREHQAYFESYLIVHTLSQLWSHLQLNTHLLADTKVLTNLGRYCLHLAEAVFEGWFIDGAQPVIDFVGKILEFLQQPQVAQLKTVRLCSQAVNSMRIVFLRVILLRLSELDETVDEPGTIHFLQQMGYWQTILFSSDNQETLFTRLICFLLYLKLTSQLQLVRLAATSLWRAILMQKPTETATLLTYSVGADQRHLSTGFMKLISLDDADFIDWVDAHRAELDNVFVEALAKPWADFVNEENRRNEETAKLRLSKRREKLRLWHTEETAADQFSHRYETSTAHWRSNVHAQERLKSQRALQDHQQSVNHIISILSKLERQLSQPCGPSPSKELPKWRLDETEGLNRMRMRILKDRHAHKESFQHKRKVSAPAPLTINTHIPKLSQDIMSAKTSALTVDGSLDHGKQDNEDRRASISDSKLLEGGFEMVDDPREDEDGLLEDKNRKVLTSLQRGDVVQQLYNISRIVGLEACEGLLVIGKKCLYLQDHYFQRSDGEIVSVSQAPEDERDPYLQLISGKDVGSQRTKHTTGDQITRHWSWSEVLSISKKRFLLRDVSLEVFFTDGRSYLLTCLTPKIRDDLYNIIIDRAPQVHGTTTVASEDAWRLDNLRNPEEIPTSIGSRFATVFSGAATHAATKKWVKGEMSNFQYLMLVNTMAGRTFNDLTQYPVFPWVLADYDSEELDLTEPKTFRDFSKPMGCQSPAREAEFRDRYKQFAEMSDQNAPAFNYGTHYSSAMIVSSYLIRLQPFVQSYLLLQGGSFDHADRLFDSIGKAWISASRDNMSDVRELTPEFFYLPEFLTNINHYDFGTKQGNGGVVNDVVLPRWAKGDPHLFITKHREALESPFVSQHLHRWIDLVFGHQQRGEAAIAATNVFQHLSYGGAKDLDTIDDPVERLATIGIIHSFGQTPHQVFHRPHPARDEERLISSRLDTHIESLAKLPSPLFESSEKVVELTYSQAQERLLCSGSGKLNMLPNCDRFVQWKLSDDSVRFISANTKRTVGMYEHTHIGGVAQAMFVDSKTLITAGQDSTITIWTITTTKDWIDMQSMVSLFGHRSQITLLTASRVFSTLLSASVDGQVLLWDLNRHDCLRVVAPAGSAPVQAARISSLSGHIALCRGPDVLLYSLNGRLLLQQRVCDTSDDEISSCSFYEGAHNEWVEQELVFTGHTNGIVNIWALTSLSDGAWHLQLVNRLNHIDSLREDGGNIAASITAILPMAHAVYTGDDHGKVWQWDMLQKQGLVSGRHR